MNLPSKKVTKKTHSAIKSAAHPSTSKYPPNVPHNIPICSLPASHLVFFSALLKSFLPNTEIHPSNSTTMLRHPSSTLGVTTPSEGGKAAASSLSRSRTESRECRSVQTVSKWVRDSRTSRTKRLAETRVLAMAEEAAKQPVLIGLGRGQWG